MAATEDISAKIISATASLERGLFDLVLKAAKKDDCGEWEQAECLLAEAEETRSVIKLINSRCPSYTPDIDSILNLVPEVCDINAVGIGVWAIGTPFLGASIGCSVLRIPGTGTPDPLQEFTQQEFTQQEFN